MNYIEEVRLVDADIDIGQLIVQLINILLLVGIIVVIGIVLYRLLRRKKS